MTRVCVCQRRVIDALRSPSTGNHNTGNCRQEAFFREGNKHYFVTAVVQLLGGK